MNALIATAVILTATGLLALCRERRTVPETAGTVRRIGSASVRPAGTVLAWLGIVIASTVAMSEVAG